MLLLVLLPPLLPPQALVALVVLLLLVLRPLPLSPQVDVRLLLRCQGQSARHPLQVWLLLQANLVMLPSQQGQAVCRALHPCPRCSPA